MKNLYRLLLILATLGLASQAMATCIPSIPYNLTNGSVADATQVMGNFNTIVSNVNTNCATAGANSNITSLNGLTTPIAAASGGSVIYTAAAIGGTANALMITATVPSNFTLTPGNIVTLNEAPGNNTGSATLNVDSSGVNTILKANGTGGYTPLTGGELAANQAAIFYVWSPTVYILINPSLALDGVNFAQGTGGFLTFGTAPVLPAGSTVGTPSLTDNSNKIINSNWLINYLYNEAITFAYTVYVPTVASTDQSTHAASTAQVASQPGVAKAYATFSGSASLTTQFNVSSVSQTGTGLYTVNFLTGEPDTGYAVSVTGQGSGQLCAYGTKNTTSINIICTGPSSASNPSEVSVVIYR